MTWFVVLKVFLGDLDFNLDFIRLKERVNKKKVWNVKEGFWCC